MIAGQLLEQRKGFYFRQGYESASVWLKADWSGIARNRPRTASYSGTSVRGLDEEGIIGGGRGIWSLTGFPRVVVKL
jgi:hypothetical protein